MKTLEQQIKSKCVHFTGIMDKTCKKGIEYDTFGSVKFNVIPCIAGGSAHCDHVKFPTDEDVDAQVNEIREFSDKSIRILIEAKKNYADTKNPSGWFKCPFGDHQARYTVAETNGHFWVACKTCNTSMNE